MGKIICLLGKSCSGKDTIYKKLLADTSLELIPLVSDARYENDVLPIKMRDIYSLEMV